MLAFGKETPVHEASCIMDVLTMMSHQVPDTSQLGALLDFRDVIQTILDSPWDRYPQKMSLAKDVRRKERIPPNSFVWIPHHLHHEAKHILRELEDVKGRLWGTSWDETARIFFATTEAGEKPIGFEVVEVENSIEGIQD